MFLKNKTIMKLSCITIDDEPFALKLISSFVEKNQDLELISSFNSSKKALNFLENNLVDCIFLDVEMPDLNGVEFAKILAKKNQKSLVVFVSAYSKYAIDGFKVSATDFLLKPYSYDDFEQSVEKIKIQKRLATLEEEFIFIKIAPSLFLVIEKVILSAEILHVFNRIISQLDLSQYLRIIN